MRESAFAVAIGGEADVPFCTFSGAMAVLSLRRPHELQQTFVVSLAMGREGGWPNSGPETATAEEALAHPAFDFVGDVPVGEAEMNGDVVFRPALPPLQEAAEQSAERTGQPEGCAAPASKRNQGRGRGLTLSISCWFGR